MGFCDPCPCHIALAVADSSAIFSSRCGRRPWSCIWCYDGARFMSTTTETAAKTQGTALVRTMTRGDLTALAINGIIGSGIFGLPAIAARLLGYASPLAFIFCALAVFVFVL